MKSGVENFLLLLVVLAVLIGFCCLGGYLLYSAKDTVNDRVETARKQTILHVDERVHIDSWRRFGIINI